MIYFPPGLLVTHYYQNIHAWGSYIKIISSHIILCLCIMLGPHDSIEKGVTTENHGITLKPEI